MKRDTSTKVQAAHLSKSLRIGTGRVPPLPDVGEHDPGPDHVGHRRACLLQRLFGDIEAADRLAVDITGGSDATARGDRRRASDADVRS